MSNKNKITLETRENKLEKIKKKGLRKTLFTTVMSMGMLLGCTGMLVGCGEAGPKGDTGAQGPQGEQGIQGEPGAAGAAGSMWFTGTAVSGTSNGIGVVVENAKVGDIYFNTTTCDIYVCTAENIWNWVSNIKGDQGIQGETGATGAIGPAGPQGPQGETGATGAAGADGATWLTGTAITGTGSNISVTITNAKLGDLYFNTSTCDLYQCVEENTWDWISNLKGDQGETGSAGVNGASWFTGTAITGTGTGISATIENTKVGDLYFNTETCNVYKCTALNTWDYLTSFKSEQTSPEATEIVVDLVMFMGQSNMAGRGDYTQATTVAEGHGYEFRAVSDPTKLYNIGGQAFGKDENRGVITESSKTGSMVPAFMESYYSYTGVPIVGVSAAKGGTSINWWQPDGNALNEAITRYNAAEEFLTENGYKIRHKYMVWCQGETDGDNAMDKDTYKTNLNTMINEMLEQGIEKAMIVRVGNHKTNATLYDNIIKAQTELCAESDDVVMVSGKLADMAEDGLMKDTFHYTQEGYNIAGADAGKNMAYYVNTGMEPYFYDRELDNYYPFGNYGSDSDTGTGGDTGSGDDTTGDDTTGDTTTESVVVNVAEATHDFASLGTVDGNKVTISSKSNTNAIQLTDVVLSDDYSWTIEMVVGNVVEGTTVLGCIGGTEGAGFITVPNMDPVNASSSTAQFRFRDKGKSLQLDFTIPTGYDATAVHHLAITYDVTTKTFKGYLDKTEIEVTYTTGTQGQAFNDTSINYLLGGYPTENLNFQGDFYYFAYHQEVLDTTEMYTPIVDDGSGDEGAGDEGSGDGTTGDNTGGDDNTGDDTTGDTTTEPVIVSVADTTYDFASLGTVDGNKVTISTKSKSKALQLTEPVVLSDDYSWTVEMVVGNMVKGTTIIACVGGTEGAGFITVPNMDPVNASSSTAQFRFRDKGKSLQLDFTIPTGYDATAVHHLAITYDVTTKTFKGYLDKTEIEVTYTTGTQGQAFNDTSINYLLGGYPTENLNFQGDFYYFAYHQEVLDTTEMYTLTDIGTGEDAGEEIPTE